MSQNISQELIDKCIQGQAKAQKQLYEFTVRQMYGICLRYCKNPEDAKDIMQEGYIRVFGKMKQFEGKGVLEAWMRRIFVNTAIEHYRRKNQLYAISESQEEQIPDQEVSALDELAADDIIRLISELPNGYRTVFNLFAVEGYSHKEIAAMMNISEGTSKSQYARAKAWL